MHTNKEGKTPTSRKIINRKSNIEISIEEKYENKIGSIVNLMNRTPEAKNLHKRYA